MSRAWLVCGLLVGAAAPAACAAQARQVEGTTSGPQLDEQLDAAEADGIEPRRQLVAWNRYEGPYFTLRVGGGFGYDFAAYGQDADSKEQMTLSPTGGVRDFRVALKGGFPTLPRLSYSFGYMYDAANEAWHVRQTGLMFDVPEWHGQLFVGRSKEGFSTNKIMVGYNTWTHERSTISDALIPILADGVKWTGRTPNGHFVYNLGYFYDDWSQTESFNKNDSQWVGRVVWLPFMGTDKPLLHLALEARHAQANNGQLQYRSRPESFLAPYAIDTGKFPASHANTTGIEAYYQPGALMFGMEYYFNQVRSPQTNDPFFHGGEVFAAYLFTGERRPYNAKGAFFEAVSPAQPVFDGGPGAVEAVLRYSYSNLDSGTIKGGKFWRITPMVSWYLSDNVRLEFVYGYGTLDRFDLTGGTQFFETRLQLQL